MKRTLSGDLGSRVNLNDVLVGHEGSRVLDIGKGVDSKDTAGASEDSEGGPWDLGTGNGPDLRCQTRW